MMKTREKRTRVSARQELLNILPFVAILEVKLKRTNDLLKATKLKNKLLQEALVSHESVLKTLDLISLKIRKAVSK